MMLAATWLDGRKGPRGGRQHQQPRSVQYSWRVRTHKIPPNGCGDSSGILRGWVYGSLVREWRSFIQAGGWHKAAVSNVHRVPRCCIYETDPFSTYSDSTDYLTIYGFTLLNGLICLHSVLDKAGSQSVFKRT